MSARPTSKRCETTGCGVKAATGQLVDGNSVWEIALDDSVVTAYALSNGMSAYNWGNATVVHHVADDKITHTIV